jgi:predicted ATPase/DNA-binding SARP family transcriptional activator
VRIFLFGGVRVTTEDGEPLYLDQARSQAVLAALALAPGVAVPVSRLIELVWGDEPPRTEKVLQWHIAQLRKAIGAEAIVRTGSAYRLDVGPDAVDVARFQRRLRDGDVSAALAEWTGPPLAGVDAPGLAATIAGLTEQWFGAVEVDLARRVDAEPAAAIGPLTELGEQHPYREELWALLMTALYRVGRQADALATYHRARDLLRENLGVEPGPRLRELEARILDQSLPMGTAQAPQWMPQRAVRLLGRDDDLDAVARALATSPMVTLVGPGGIGKTRLALAAASRQGEGGWWVDLAEVASPDDVVRVAAETLGVTPRPGTTLTQSIVAQLRHRAALVVLDNCEHVLVPAAELAAAIAEGCAQLRLLATSRERLGVPGEQVVAVGPLPVDAAVELFHDRAVAVDATYDPIAYPGDVDELCRRLDRIPLAIELAAARSRAYRPPDLLAHLDPTGAQRGGAPRHRTLRSTMQWSYDLLAPSERTVFEAVSVFSGPFPASAAAVVSDSTVDDDLVALVERSMLDVAFDPARGRRFRLLETVRQFAAEVLEDHGRTELVARRHARWCLAEVSAIGQLLRGPDEGAGVARLADLRPNLRTAVRWACGTGDAALADALVRPVTTELTLRAAREVGDWAEEVLAVVPADQADRRAFWLLWVAERYVQAGDPAGYGRVVQRYREPDRALSRYARAYATGDGAALWESLPAAVAELRAQDEEFLAAFVELNSAGTLLGAGRFAEVDAIARSLADRYGAQGPPTALHWTLQTLAYSASFQGRPAQAEAYFDEAAAIDLPEGALSANKVVQARSAFRRGRHQEAFATLLSYVDEQVETGNMAAASVVGVEFVNMMAALDRRAEAAHMYGYLVTANEFGALAAQTLVAAAARKIAADAPDVPPARLDDRDALVYMRGVLADLTSAPIMSWPS